MTRLVKAKKQNEELATGMIVRNAALEQIGYKVEDKERIRCITTKIPDDRDVAIPSEYPSEYRTRSLSPNNSWSRKMVEEYEHERSIRQQERQGNLQSMWLQS